MGIFNSKSPSTGKPNASASKRVANADMKYKYGLIAREDIDLVLAKLFSP